jgi:hypothetical protein
LEASVKKNRSKKSCVEIPSNNGAFIDLGRKKEEEREKELG